MERVTSRILIAEDDPAVASVPDEGLSASGFAATVVGDGRDALERADEVVARIRVRLRERDEMNES